MKLQNSKNTYSVFINKHIINLLGWKKGDYLIAKIKDKSLLIKKQELEEQ